MTAQLTDEQIDSAARQAGATAYTNRFVNGSAFSFGPESLRAFVSAIIAADLALCEQAQAHPYLLDGMRFKIGVFSPDKQGRINGIPGELCGRWVAFVAAENDCHMHPAAPQAQSERKPVQPQGEPASHPAPTCPGLWVCLRDGWHKSYTVHDPLVWVTAPEPGDRWYGPIPQEPAPDLEPWKNPLETKGIKVGVEVENADARFFVGAINESQYLCSLDKTKPWVVKAKGPMARCIEQGNYAASAITLSVVPAPEDK